MEIGGISGAGGAYGKIFDRVDQDKSQGLSLDEFTKIAEKFAERTGRPELALNVKETFASIDKDGSGELSTKELRAHLADLRSQYREEFGGRRGDDGGEDGRRGRPDGPGRRIGHLIGHIFRRADEDRNGSLNLDEFTALQEKRAERSGNQELLENIEELFNQIDASGDGEITPQELVHYLQEKFVARRQAREEDGPPAAAKEDLLAPETNAALLTVQESSEGTESDGTEGDDEDETRQPG